MCIQEARIQRNGKWELMATGRTREEALIAAAEMLPIAEQRWIFVKLAGAWEYYFRQQNQTKNNQE